MPFAQFDRSRLKLLPLEKRIHDLDLSIMVDPDQKPDYTHPTIDLLAQRIRNAKEHHASVLMMMGGHVVRAGVAPCLIRLMEEGYITHFAFNGATAIHDFEFAMIGATTESVAKYISEGQFGLWEEDGQYTSYLYDGSSWISSVMDLGDLEQYDAQQSMDLYIQSGADYAHRQVHRRHPGGRPGGGAGGQRGRRQHERHPG